MTEPADLVPETFRALLAGRRSDGDGPDGDAWLRVLPSVIEDALRRWSLTPDGDARHGHCAVVIPVRRKAECLALKVSWPHAEARHEHLALRAWRGVGAVKLVAADPASHTVLLERCRPATRLTAMSALDACETVGGLHARLAIPALPQLDTASAWCERIAERLSTQPPPLPRRFVTQGVSLARSLAQERGVDALLVHTDLHDDNVMAASRSGTVDGFVAIDPKPLAGNLALTVAPLLWNRWDEAATAYNLRNHLRFRVDYACDPLGIAPEAARAWSIVRLLDNAWWATHDAQQRRGSAPDLTREVAIIKAMQG